MPVHMVPGASLEYDVIGEGHPTVVQLHGLTSSRARDAQLGLDLGRAVQNGRVIRYDARGHGGSSGTHDESAYGWDRLAYDLLDLLEGIAPGEKIHAVGPSMGTGTLLHAATRRPERFASLTLVAPPTAWESRRVQASIYRRKADIVESDGIDAFVELGSTAPVPPALAHQPRTRPTISEALLPTVMRGAAATDLPAPDLVSRISIPTLVLAWSSDPSHPVSTATRLGELIEPSTVHVAHTGFEILTWPGLFAEHVEAHS